MCTGRYKMKRKAKIVTQYTRSIHYNLFPKCCQLMFKYRKSEAKDQGNLIFIMQQCLQHQECTC